MNEAGRGRAVVIGGGVGGLLTAAAVARGAREVVVVERDVYPSLGNGLQPPPARLGAPQSRCLHMLTVAGMRSFDALVPGWREEVEAAGGRLFDLGSAAFWRLPTGWLPRFETGLTIYACSRGLLEQALRRCLEADDRIRILEGRRVDDLLQSSQSRVCGVHHVGDEGGGQLLLADLVVDASGRGSALPRWWRNADRAPIRETTMPTRWRYSSQWFELDVPLTPDCNVLSVAPRSPGADALLAFRSEGPFWGVVLLTAKSSEPPRNPLLSDLDAMVRGDGLIEQPEDSMMEALDQFRLRARPVSPIFHLGDAKSRWRHVEEVDAWPHGFIVLGDAVCALDPSHGLGMTAAATAAEQLGEQLDSVGRDGLRDWSTSTFQRRLATLNSGPWELTTGRSPNGEPTRGLWHLRRLGNAALKHPEAALELLEIRQMMRPVAAG